MPYALRHVGDHTPRSYPCPLRFFSSLNICKVGIIFGLCKDFNTFNIITTEVLKTLKVLCMWEIFLTFQCRKTGELTPRRPHRSKKEPHLSLSDGCGNANVISRTQSFS